MPTDLSSFRANNDYGTKRRPVKNHECTGKIVYKNMKFKNTPPLLIFTVLRELAKKIENLSLIPSQILVHGETFFLGGCTVNIPRGSHYVAYIFHTPTKMFFYCDALKSHFSAISNDSLKDGIISLIIYFRKLEQENDNAVLEKDVQDGDQTDFINDRTHDSIHLDVKLDAATADTTYDEKDNGNGNVERGANVGVDEADIISDEKFFQRCKWQLCRRSRIKKSFSRYIVNTPPSSPDEFADLQTAILLSKTESDQNLQITDDQNGTSPSRNTNKKAVRLHSLVDQIKENKLASVVDNIDKKEVSNMEKQCQGETITEDLEGREEVTQEVKEKEPMNEVVKLQSNECDDEYGRMLQHVMTCKIKSKELIRYKMHDRYVARINSKGYLLKLRKYIKERKEIPTNKPIIMAIDKENEAAILWEGNLRITCISNMKDGEYPECVRVKFIFMNLKAEVNYQGLLPRLKFVPNTWPTWLWMSYGL